MFPSLPTALGLLKHFCFYRILKGNKPHCASGQEMNSYPASNRIKHYLSIPCLPGGRIHEAAGTVLWQMLYQYTILFLSPQQPDLGMLKSPLEKLWEIACVFTYTDANIYNHQS